MVRVRLAGARVAVLLTVMALQPVTVAAEAQYPALFDVTGVAADDVLNVRSAPAAGADIVATLPPDRRHVEVLQLSQDGRWAQVALGEAAGWAALDYLSAQLPRPAGQVPAPMRCLGTEPFWGLTFPGDGSAEYERYPEPELPLRVTLETPPEGRTGELAVVMESASSSATAFLRREACSDGMSDRPYGLSLRLLVRGPGGVPVAHAGCCSLTGP